MKTRHILLIDRYLKIHNKIEPYASRISLITHKNESKPKGFENINYDYILALDSFQFEEVLNGAKLINDSDKITAVMSFDDKYQEFACQTANYLSLKFLYAPEVCKSIRNKWEMRKILNESGLDSLPNAIISSPLDIDKFISKNGLPIILKPVASQGSASVTVIKNNEDKDLALNKFKTCTPNEVMYVEKFIVGKEFSVECYSENGKHKLICIVEKFIDEIHCFSLGHRIPARLNQSIRKTIKEYVFSCLDALSIKFGPTHTEIILTNTGPKIIETHTRAAGAYIPYVIKKLYGIDIQDLWIRQFLGESILDQVYKKNSYNLTGVIWFKHSSQIGVLDEISGIKKTLEIPGVLMVEAIQPRLTVLKQVSSRDEDRVACVIVTHNEPDVALAISRIVINELKIVYL